MAVTLASIALPDDLVWIDEFEWEPVAHSSKRALGGAQVIEETGLTGGRPITLGTDSQWVTRATLNALQVLRALPAQTHALTLRSQTFTVMFRRPALRATPVIEFADPVDDDQYAIQLFLMTV